MFVTYPVHTVIISDAIKIATNLAKASGYKHISLSKAIQVAASSWDIILIVSWQMQSPVTCLSNVCGVAVKCALNTLIMSANLVALGTLVVREFIDERQQTH